MQLDDYSLVEVFKRADPLTVETCRLVCRAWNLEIQRIRALLRKFQIQVLTVELDADFVAIEDSSTGGARFRRVCLPTGRIAQVLERVNPPECLNILVNADIPSSSMRELFVSIDSNWSFNIKQLEILNFHDDFDVEFLKMFPNIRRISFSNYSRKVFRCAKIFQFCRKLEEIRLCTDEDGMMLDEEAFRILAENQRIESNLNALEIFNATIAINPSQLVECLTRFPDNSSKSPTNLVFANCYWISAKIHDYLTEISQNCQSFYFPCEFDKSDYYFTFKREFCVNFNSRFF